MSEERRDAGPYDREIDAALAWAWSRAPTFDPADVVGNHQCALSAVVEWYYKHRDTIAALQQWHERHRAWYEATDPAGVTPKQFDAAHYEMAAAWQRVVKALEASEKGGGQ